jgi:galactose mutarotase-like enzyme
MLHVIDNGQLRVSISTAGAELQSIKTADGIEYLWQGDPAYWGDRAPNIFPYVARLTNESYTYRGTTYHLPIHGFAPTAIFSVTEESSDSVTFTLENNPVYYEMYPFLFRFSIRYYLEDQTLHVDFIVENRDAKTMYFGIGGHPGINVPLEDGLTFEDYYLEFGCVKSPKRVIMSESCHDSGVREDFALEDGKIIRLRHDLFDNDGIFLQDMCKKVTLKSTRSSKFVQVHYPQMKFVGFWHATRTDAPYVCIEPWLGLPAYDGQVDELSTKHEMLTAAPGTVYENSFTMTIGG